MILKCKEKQCSFTIGKEYICFGIIFNEYRQITQVYVRRDSDLTPVLMKLSNFEIINPEIPSGWHVSTYEYEGKIRTYIEPQEFSGDFWDLYNDGDLETEQIFENVYEKLVKYYKF